MKMRKPTAYYILLFVGVIMAAFGSEIENSITLPKSWAGHLLLPGYSVGLLMICGSMVLLLGAQVRDLQSKVEELSKTKN